MANITNLDLSDKISGFHLVGSTTPPPLPNDFTKPLGNYTNNFATPTNRATQRKRKRAKAKKTDKEIADLRYTYKKSKNKLKGEIGKLDKRVKGCGIYPINSKEERNWIPIVKGAKGNVWYHGMQRCGKVNLCPDCQYKINKERASTLYDQLKIYKEEGKVVLFTTFTIQHKLGDRLKDLNTHLKKAFQFANSHREWKEYQASNPIAYMWTLEVLFGKNGWHPHRHSLFVADNESILAGIDIFAKLYKRYLQKHGFLVNSHTVKIDKWNGKLSDMKDYMFKGMIEKEVYGSSTKKGVGKSFFELVEDDQMDQAKEYVKSMHGVKANHKSKGFYRDIEERSESEILKDDTTDEIITNIPMKTFRDIRKKGIARDLLNEYEYGGLKRMEKFLVLYDVDTRFME